MEISGHYSFLLQVISMLILGLERVWEKLQNAPVKFPLNDRWELSMNTYVSQII
jgi:hypothetical protein